MTVAHGLFSYGQGKKKMALRGSTIEVDEDDYERGTAMGAFVDAPSDLTHHGDLPTFDFSEDEESDINAWMRSAATTDVAAALAAAAAEGRDIRELMLAGELSRGNEVRVDVLELLANAPRPSDGDDPPAPVPPPADPDPAEPASDKIDDVVAWVGTDPEKAAIALQREHDSKADKARPRLVAQLEEILAGNDSRGDD